MLPEDGFQDEVAPQDRTGPGHTGLGGQDAGKAQNSPSIEAPHTVDTLPLGAVHPGDAVMPGQRVVHEGVVSIQYLQDGAIFLEQMLEEADAFFLDGPAQALVETREEPLVLLDVPGEASNMDPLGGELYGQAPDPIFPEHPQGLTLQGGRISQPPRRRLQELRIGQGGPEEVAQPRGQLQARDRPGFLTGRWVLHLIEKMGRDEDP